MRFKLKAELTLSADLEPARQTLERLLQGSGELLVKGAPPGKEAEATKLKGWRLKGKKLELELESGRYVRAHDALLRLARLLGEELGQKHKIGLRGLRGLEYEIHIPAPFLPERARRELEAMPYEIELREDEVVLHLRDLDEASLRGRVVDRLVAQVTELLTKPPAPPPEARVVRQGKPVEHPFTQDPFEAALKLGWVKEFPGRGQWIYTSPFTDLLMALESLIVDEIARKLGFEEVMFPKLIPLEVMQHMPGYLDELPEGMYYVCPPPREPEAFEEFKRKFKLTKKLPLEELSSCLKKPSYVLAPAQCEPFYELCVRRELKLEDLPLKFFDRSGWTYRWEGGAVEGLIRTQEFRRIEFVFAGSPQQVVEIRDQVLDQSVNLVERLGLGWRVLAATPFYMREGGIEEDISNSSKVATYDLEVELPYKRDWLELGSYNVHRRKFVDSFKIKELRGRELWTGCCGFGTTRWTVGFLAQHGFDQSRWPKLVRQRLPGG